MTNKKEIVVYKDGELNIDVQFSPEEETVWLTQKQIELLYDVSQATVSEHIANILSTGELDQTSIGISDKSTGGRKPMYFMIKDHPFADGCKRIAASLFLEFLNRNHILFKDGRKSIEDGTLVAITLMIAESDPAEKDIMVTMVMNLLSI